MTCSWCRRELASVHGHAACLDARCAMFGTDQDERCDGATAASPAPAPGGAPGRRNGFPPLG